MIRTVLSGLIFIATPAMALAQVGSALPLTKKHFPLRPGVN
jgi:hypothetical protein